MSRKRKWLLATGLTAITLVVLVAIALAWLLYTPSGLRFALDRGVALTHEQFSYAGADGTLAGEVTLEGLRYHNDSGTSLGVARATVALQPWAMLAGRLHVERARIDGVQLTLAPSTQPQEPAEFSLEPPLDLILDDVVLTRIEVTPPDAATFTADRLAIAGRWTRRGLEFTRLALEAPAGSVTLAGTLDFGQGYRGQGQVDIDWSRQGTRYVAELSAKSDGRTAHVQGSVSAPARAQVDATLALDRQHAWTVDIKVPRFDARVLAALPSSLQTLAIELHGTGNASGGKLEGSVEANGHVARIDPAQFAYDGKTLEIARFRLTSPSSPGVVNATGIVHLDAAPVTAALDVDWQEVALPADLVGQVLATHGTAHVAGSMEAFAVQGGLALGPPGKLSDLQLDLTGSPRAIEVNTLKLVQQDGGLELHGRIRLDPEVSWQLDAVATHFDPGTILAGWNGAMDFRLATRGKITPKGPDANIKLDHTGGSLRGRSIAGSRADLRITPTNLLDGSLLLVTGNSRVHAEGQPGPRTRATVTLDVASLRDWLPDAAGQVHGRFEVVGSWPRLALDGQLQGEGLRMDGSRIDHLQLKASVPDLHEPGGDIGLALAGVHAAGLDFETITLEGHGTQAAHKLTLDARGRPLGLKASLEGRWQPKSRRWSGTLSGVELSPRDLPTWHQQQPAAITWQSRALSLGEFCLSAGSPRFCASGSRSARGVVDAEYQLEQLPLQLFASLVERPDPLQAVGQLSGAGKFALDASGSVTGTANLKLGPGHIAFASTANQPLLAWSSIALEATADARNQHVTVSGALAGGGRIEGAVDVDGSTRALGGHLAVDLQSLGFLSALSPEIANVSGSLAGQLQFGGTVSEPQFTGSLRSQGFSAELPRAGLKLHDGVIAVTGSPGGRLAVTGQIASGQGVLHIDGNAGLAADAPLTLDLEGENVLVADIPAAHVLASPDLHITRADGAFALTGTVTIPSASIQAEKLPGQGPTQASPDVVIVDAPPPEEVAPLALDADIEVRFGDDVKVHGYGFNGSVHGQLAVRVRPGRTAVGRGEVRIAGKYEAYGQNLSIERGRLLFAGTRLDNPGLDIRAVRNLRNQDVTVGLSIGGTAQRPILTVFSDPAMEQAEALSYLVTGRPLDALKSGEGDTLNTAAQALGGLAGDRLAKSIGSRLGLEAGVSSSEALGGSAFTAGKYLSPRLYLSYGVGLFTPGQVITLRYTLNRFLQFEAENATTGNRASFNYRIEK